MTTIDITPLVEETDKQIVLLDAEHELTLHMNVARVFLNKNWRINCTGLIQFATFMTILWKAHFADDPYADWYLLKTYDALAKTQDNFVRYESILQQQLDDFRGLKISLYSHPMPLKKTLRFATSFSLMATILIEKFDYIARQLYTLKRIGVIPKEKITMSDLMREIQVAFKVARKWKHTGVTRKDLQDNNQNALRARSLLGEVPSDILNKEVEFTFLPFLRKN